MTNEQNAKNELEKAAEEYDVAAGYTNSNYSVVRRKAFIAGAAHKQAEPQKEIEVLKDILRMKDTLLNKVCGNLEIAENALEKIRNMSDYMDNGCYASGQYHEKIAKEALAAIRGSKGSGK